MAKDDTQSQEKKIGVIVDQDGLFLRLEQDDVELEEGKDFDLYEEEVEKEDDDETEDAGTPPTKTPSAELEEGDEVVFTPEVAKLFNSDNGVFLEAISTVEAKVQVNGEEQVVGFESFRKA